MVGQGSRWSVLVSGLLIASCGGSDSSGPSLLPEVTGHSGPVMAHVQLVPIFFADDTDAATLTSFSQWIVASQWLKAVGADYGVDTGAVLGVVHRTDAAPARIDDTDIVKLLYAGLADGSLPKPAGGLADALYMFFFPARTTITAGGDTSCDAFGGYHNSARQGGVEVAYAVIAACTDFVQTLDDVEDREFVASHELIEAATDPIPGNHPGFQLDDPTSSWLVFGSEVADLCQRGDGVEVWRESGFVAQRSWSTAAAAADQDPCVPGANPNYLSVSAQRATVPRIAPGGHQAIGLRGWASGTARGTSWELRAALAMTGAATLTLSTQTIKDGATLSLDVAVPASAPVGSLAQLFVLSSADMGATFQLTPMYAVVGDPCSKFTTCETCSSELGCGFCASSGKCEAVGGPTSSAESSCSGGSFATWPGSCKGFCASHTSCADCSSQGGCGWCSSGQPQCVEASHDTGQQASGSCPYENWSFTPDYCSQ
jgi:hypothetical protein